MKDWKIFEENVKKLASYMWNCNSTSMTISGVKCDCVLQPKKDYWIIVEITEDHSLNKVRTDISKLNIVKNHLFSKRIYSENYIVMRIEPTDSMKTTGGDDNIDVMSYKSFSKLFLDFNIYNHARLTRNFGSAINPFSGKPDTINYTPVLYENIQSNKLVKLKEIVDYLLSNQKVILLGNYGTGKSRCIQELFNILSRRSEKQLLYPVAINLKENWGTQGGEEILRRHLGSLGLGNLSESMIKSYQNDCYVFLLDGFDEIGAQVWSDSPTKLQQIRASSLRAVKDLIQTTKSPILIAGREHYFNSNEEMFNTFGLNKKDTIVLKCKDEFTEEEMNNYLKELSIFIDMPVWLPRRPLICQIINTIEKEEFENIFINSHSAIEFWNKLITGMCDREAKISPILQSSTIFSILKRIAYFTRNKSNNVGPITINEINRSFELVVGTPPADESAVILQRLPALGRTSSESRDRQFIDSYILDGLRAENLIDIIYQNDTTILTEKWQNPLNRIGIEVISKRMEMDKSANVFIEFLKKSLHCENKIITGDILASLVYNSTETMLDLGGLIVHQTIIGYLNFSSRLIQNFTIEDSYIEEIVINDSRLFKVSIKDCIVNFLYGVYDKNDIPSNLVSCIIENTSIENSSRYTKRIQINPANMVLLFIIRKLFYLSPKTRTEKELLARFDNEEEKKLVLQILDMLVKEKVVRQSTNGKIIEYTAKGHPKARMLRILKELDSSKDSVWIKTSQLLEKII